MKKIFTACLLLCFAPVAHATAPVFPLDGLLPASNVIPVEDGIGGCAGGCNNLGWNSGTYTAVNNDDNVYMYRSFTGNEDQDGGDFIAAQFVLDGAIAPSTQFYIWMRVKQTGTGLDWSPSGTLKTNGQLISSTGFAHGFTMRGFLTGSEAWIRSDLVTTAPPTYTDTYTPNSIGVGAFPLGSTPSKTLFIEQIYVEPVNVGN